MKRIILSILSVFITLGAAAETEQALPAVQRAATAAVEETPSGNEDTVPPETSDTPGTGTEIYTSIEASEMKVFVTGKNEYNNFESQYPEQIKRLREKLPNINEEGNPFLIIYYFKK